MTGKVNAADLSAVINYMGLNNWEHVTLDLSGLTEYPVAGSWPKMWKSNIHFDVYILPSGFGDVTSSMTTYVDDANAGNGIFNIYDKLHYVIVPASGSDSDAKIYVYRYKTDVWPYTPTIVGDLASADKSFFTGDH